MNAQDMKNSILQLAIQGRLVEQRKEEGTAKELLEQIKAEREQLIKEKKIKKEKPLTEITEDEIPFEIPDSWKWVKLGTLAELITKGSSPSWQGIKYIDEGGLLFVTSENVGVEQILLKNPKYLEERFNEIQERSILKKGDILTNIVGASIGRTAIYDRDDLANINQAVCLIRLINRRVNGYIVKYLNSYVAYKIMMNDKVDTARANISLTNISNFIVPLPPLAEQKRIVTKLEELMPYVEKYGEAHSKLEVFNKKFPEDMQKSILHYAIQGKLVEQRDEEGTAKELYQLIQEEKVKLIKEGKIKKEKVLPAITEDEIPFSIPVSWKWVRLGNVIDLLSGQDFSPEKYNDTNKGIPYITGASSLSDNGVIVKRWTEVPRCIANAGDVLLVCKGSGYGRTVVCDIEEGHIARQIMSIKFSIFIDMIYLKYFMSANYALIKKWGQGVIPGIDRKSIQNMLFPLPPLQEQKRIVAKIEELIPYCQQLIK